MQNTSFDNGENAVVTLSSDIYDEKLKETVEAEDYKQD